MRAAERGGTRSVGIARHGRLKRSNPFAALFRWVAMAMAVVVVSAASVAAIAVWSFSQKIDDNAIDIGGQGDAAGERELDSYTDGFSILLVGVDNDAAQGAAYGVRDGTLNDVNILVHVSADHTNAVVVSIPRDLIVSHPECTDAETGETYAAMSASPVNEAMSRGGLPCVVQTISELTGLDIPFAGLITFSGVVQMSDAVGGVPICLDAAINDSQAGLDLPEGTNVISGENALAFLRSRKGVGDRSDLARISSQQIYLASLLRTVKSNGTLTSIPTLITLADAAATNIRLSTNLAHIDTMVSMALALKDIDLDRLIFVQYPGTTDDPEFPNKVVPIQALADDLFAKIAADEPFTVSGTTPEPPVDAPVPEEAEAPTDAGPTAAAPAPAIPVLEGVPGRTAKDESCAQAFRG